MGPDVGFSSFCLFLNHQFCHVEKESDSGTVTKLNYGTMTNHFITQEDIFHACYKNHKIALIEVHFFVG